MSLALNFLGTRRGNQGKRLDDIVVLSNQPAEQGVSLTTCTMPKTPSIYTSSQDPGNGSVTGLIESTFCLDRALHLIA